MNVLEVNNLTKSLGKREIIKGISFNIKSGEIFGFLGPNGAGKTTLIKIICGIYKPSKGVMLINGIDSKEIDMKSYRKLFATVYQAI